MKKSSLALNRETVRSLDTSKLGTVVGGISRPRLCNFSDDSCNGSNLRYGCQSGPETDTAQYSRPCP